MPFAPRVKRAPGQLTGIRKLTDPKTGRTYYRVRRKGHGDVRKPTLAAARAEWHRMYDPAAAPVYAGDRKVTIAKYAEIWLRDLDHLAPSTRESYTDALRLVTTRTPLGSRSLVELSTTEVGEYFRWLRNDYRGPRGRLAPNTIRLIKTALSALFTHAVAAGIRPVNPIRAGAKLPKPARSRIDPPTPDEVRMLLAAAADDSAMHALVALAIHTGARIGELLALGWQHVELDPTDGGPARIRIEHTMHADQRVLGPAKHGSRRTVTIASPAVAALRAHRDAQRAAIRAAGAAWRPYPVPGGLVFTMPGGAAVRQHYAGISLHRLADRAGVTEERLAGGHEPLTWHDFRHAHATAWLRMHPGAYAQLQRRLGHASIRQTVDTYAHLEADTADSAAIEQLAGLYR